MEHNEWLREYIESDRVEILQSRNKSQQDDYDNFLAPIKKFTWMIQIDLDEFIFCPAANTSLESLLESKYRDSDYIRISWKLFIHETSLQPKSVIESNLLTHNEDRDPTSPVGIKCLARTRFLQAVRIHRCMFNRKIDPVYLPAHNDDIQVNHYRTQSDEFLIGVKRQRGAGTHPHAYKEKAQRQKDYSTFNRIDQVLKNKRQKLIFACNSRPQVRPKIYPDSPWRLPDCP